MVESTQAPAAQATEVDLQIVARVTFYKPATGKNKRATKPTKDVKAKRFSHKFATTKEGYLALLTSILEKHYLDKKFKVYARNVYPCKIQAPPAKVRGLSEGNTLVPFAKSAKKVDNPGLSKDEYKLAKEHTKLEKKYQNDHDAGYTFIDATGVAVPLTPFMLKEWARALVDKDKNVDLDNPPFTQMFDPANRQSSLVNRRRSESSGSGEVASESLTLTAVSALINSVALLVKQPPPPDPVMPKKLQDLDTNTLDLLPLQLSRFLTFAQSDAGVSNASQFRHSLSGQGYGPDILHLVDDKPLCDLGIPADDVIRLKQATPIWWKGEPERLAKRSPGDAEELDQTPPNKKMQSEKCFHYGGSMTTHGPGIIAGNLPEDADFTISTPKRSNQLHLFQKDLNQENKDKLALGFVFNKNPDFSGMVDTAIVKDKNTARTRIRIVEGDDKLSKEFHKAGRCD
ncbi:hypothetical protein B0H34DRAFT_783652 [Crassisporium funariophilum]|nr:hypothetical protein B0H34DRAFT_783652 [Crassisporium funariophilum]